MFIDQLRSNGWEKISSREINFEKSIFNLPKRFIYSLPTLKNKNMNILSIPNLKYFSNHKNMRLFSKINFEFKPILSLSSFN